ncbi:glycosyltransferase [Polynucleobacter nymphae]|uniref:glycosyltransferase n=1 Tax=Polynucleobacter nymphae TaxID=2081043 RepID=UPI001C0B5C1B|nr:glycosyltransferase [Polynucleobacter nymphae]MBU3607777.1 glycosyltransferase [Polynucleobacter nymphae]
MEFNEMRVRVVPLQPHGLTFGGFELQMLNAMNAVAKQGLDIKPLDFWRQDDNYEVLHLWGLSCQHINSAYWAKKTGKKVFLSALTRYPNFYNNWRIKLSAKIGSEKVNLQLLENIDGISVVNIEQKLFLSNVYGYPLNKIFVIPNIVDDIFYNCDVNNSEHNQVHLKDYIITTGNICNRKNQLNLTQACINANIPLLIVGKGLPGEEAYLNKVKKLVESSSNIVWINGLEPASNDLYMAYKKAIAFALPSKDETQPISALEAAVMHKPLLLGNGEYARQKLFSGATLVDCDSVKKIQNSLLYLIRKDTSQKFTQNEYLNECRGSFVGKSYINAYSEILEL